jgi:hypothetical protein
MGNLVWIIVVFLLLIGIFHIAFIRYPRSRGFWLKTDYIWLGVAALALIPPTAEIRKIRTGYRAELLKTLLESSEKFLDNTLAALQWLLSKGYAYDRWINNKEEIPKFMAAAEWLVRARTALNRGYESIVFQNFPLLSGICGCN